MDTSMVLKTIGELTAVLARESNSANESRQENARILERILILEQENTNIKAKLEEELLHNVNLTKRIDGLILTVDDLSECKEALEKIMDEINPYQSKKPDTEQGELEAELNMSVFRRYRDLRRKLEKIEENVKEYTTERDKWYGLCDCRYTADRNMDDISKNTSLLDRGEGK